MNKTTIGMIGAGNMGSAIIRRIQNNYRILVCEKSAGRRRALKQSARAAFVDLPELAKRADIIFLAVKPQDFGGVLKALCGELTSRQRAISIAAGITTTYIEKTLGGKPRVIRAMPNLPALIGEGMTGLSAGRYARPADLREAVRIFDCVGRTQTVKEKWIDAVTAVSGSGPAYVFLFAECLHKAARSLGLKEKEAAALVNQTLIGSMHLLTRDSTPAAEWRARVTSKGGTTQAAMDVFFKNRIDSIFTAALKAARKRAAELSRR